jgi:hypothetical protein
MLRRLFEHDRLMRIGLHCLFCPRFNQCTAVWGGFGTKDRYDPVLADRAARGFIHAKL